jgi:hypothetical protein
MAWELSFRQIEAIDPVASDLLTLCSLLGPDEIPLRLFRDGSMLLPQSLSDAAGIDLSGLRGPMATLRQFSLAQSDEKSDLGSPRDRRTCAAAAGRSGTDEMGHHRRQPRVASISL